MAGDDDSASAVARELRAIFRLSMILIVSPNLAVDQTIHVDDLVAGQVHRSKYTRREPGGKGANVARVLTTLEIPCVLMGFVGGSQGEFISHGLKQEAISFKGCSMRNESRTCYLLVDDERLQQTVVNEPGLEVNPEEVECFVSLFREQIGACKWVIFAGSLPPGVPAGLYARLIHLAHG